MSSVTYGSIPYVDKPVSQIFYGTAIQPYLTGQDANELLDAIYAAGITAFDCARNYMAAELSLGKWIDARGNRDKIVLLTKCGHPSMFGKKRINEKEIRKDFAKSSKYLHTDYFDIYLLHRDDPDVEAGTIVEIFNALHAEGKIGAFGGSNWMHQRIEQANEYAYAHNLIPFSVSSPNFGLADQINDPWGHGCVTISGPSQAEARRWYEQNGMPVIAYSSLGRGLFSGKLKSTETDKAASILDGAAMKGYGYPENYERLRRCELLAEKKVYGDNVFKKTGINREGAGRYKKTRYFSGKQGISAGTGPRVGLGLLDKLRRGRRRGRRSFFAPRTAQEGPRNGGSGAGHIRGPGAGKALYIKAYKAGGPLHPPRKSQQQQTKEGGLCGPW